VDPIGSAVGASRGPVELDRDVVLVGCYTPHSGGGRGAGIVAAVRDPASGSLTPAGVVARTPSPSFLVRHPRLPVVYAANELATGTVSAWRLTDGAATPLGTEGTGGDSPCHVAVTPDGRHLLVANYGSGSVAVHPLDEAGAVRARSDLLAHDGHGPDPQRQASPHTHMVAPDPRGGPVLAVDLGTDAIYPYTVEHGRLIPHGHRIHLRRGSGPRHLARHPDGRRIYVAGELDATVTVLVRDDRGWHERHRLPSSARPAHRQPSGIAVRADGRFLYVANRGVDTVAVFALDAGSAPPEPVAEVGCGGEWPRHFAMTGGHLYVANERSHGVAVFAVDGDTGIPAPCGDPMSSPSPTCVLPTAPSDTASNVGFLAT
jgi:6-phosphogluconolactonase